MNILDGFNSNKRGKLCPTQFFMSLLIKMMVMMVLMVMMMLLMMVMMMTIISHICCWYSLPSLSTVSVSVVSSAVPSVVDGLGCERNLQKKLSFISSEGKLGDGCGWIARFRILFERWKRLICP